MNNYQQYRPQGFKFLPLAVKNLLIINVICFLATMVLQRTNGIDLNDYLGLHFFKAESFAVYQYISYMFMHGNWSHIFFNMFALWMFGYTLENYWGTKRFLLYYFVTGIGAGVVQEIVWFIELRDVIYSTADMVNVGGTAVMAKEIFYNNFVTVGASGAVYGLLLAFGMMFPNALIYVYFLFPIKAKWFVIIYGAIELISGLFSHDSIAHFAHLGGMIFGFILIKYWQRKDKNKHFHYTKN